MPKVTLPADVQITILPGGGIGYAGVTVPTFTGAGTRPMLKDDIQALVQDGLAVVNHLKASDHEEWPGLAYEVVLLAAGELSPQEQIDLETRIRKTEKAEGRRQLAKLFAGAREQDTMPTVDAVVAIVRDAPADFFPAEVQELQELRDRASWQRKRIEEQDLEARQATAKIEALERSVQNGVPLAEHNRIVGEAQSKEGQLRFKLADLEMFVERLQKFKDYVHATLTDMGIPEDPPGQHRDAGCRIGQRLALVYRRVNDTVAKSAFEAVQRDLADSQGHCANLEARLKVVNCGTRMIDALDHFFSINGLPKVSNNYDPSTVVAALAAIQQRLDNPVLPALSVAQLTTRITEAGGRFTAQNDVAIDGMALFGVMNNLRRLP